MLATSRVFVATFALATILSLTGCVTEERTATGQSRPSSIPWNSPAEWEGPGVYGSAINGQ